MHNETPHNTMWKNNFKSGFIFLLKPRKTVGFALSSVGHRKKLRSISLIRSSPSLDLRQLECWGWGSGEFLLLGCN